MQKRIWRGETLLVHVPFDDAVLTPEWLSGALESSASWGDGAVHVVGSTRIGEIHGMSGRLHRVRVETETGKSLSIVVKQETAEAVERELLARRHFDDRILGSLAVCYAGTTEASSGRGVLVLEDIVPATQGDVLGGCTLAGAEAVILVLARLHAATLHRHEADFAGDLPRWPVRATDTDRWVDRLTRARKRFPDVLGAELAPELGRLPQVVEASLDRLRSGPAAWMHADAHLDNVLWRLDGNAVILDWCNASVGPPAVDLARFLSEGVERRWRQALVSAYVDELRRNGVEDGPMSIENQVVLALPSLLQSAIGWAGRPDLPEGGRPAAVCAAWLESVCGWATEGLGTGS